MLRLFNHLIFTIYWFTPSVSYHLIDIYSAEVIRDHKTGDSLCYAFIGEFVLPMEVLL